MSPTLRIVVPPVWPGVFGRVADLLAASARALGFRAEVVECEASPRAALNVVIGWSVHVPAISSGARYVVYQLEPLEQAPWPERLVEARALFDGAAAVWDYSSANVAAGGGRSRWLPLRHHPELASRVPTAARRRWDVLFAGAATPRRQRLLAELSGRCCVTARLRWGDDLDAALPYTRILLNLHASDAPTPLEQPRVWAALSRGCLVISEESADAPYEGLVTLPYSELVEGTLAYLHDPPACHAARERSCTAFERGPGMAAELRDALADLAIEPPSPARAALDPRRPAAVDRLDGRRLAREPLELQYPAPRVGQPCVVPPAP